MNGFSTGIVCCFHVRNSKSQVSLVPAPHRFFSSLAPKHMLHPLPKLDETADQTSGFAQMCGSLRTVALDLASRSCGPDTSLK